MDTRTAISSKARSGGKIVRSRSAAGIRKTPYARPLPATSQPSNVNASESNWLAKFVLPPTRFIANGAGNFISSIFRPSSASTSDCSSDSGSEYEEEEEEDEDDENKGDELEEYVDANNEMAVKNLENHPQDFVWSSDAKRMIARLLSRESFSREECDILKSIIESRVSNFTLQAMGCDVDGSQLRSSAITEAKRWVEDKKYQPDLEFEMCVTNFFEEGENNVNSPVDVAKSYMQTLPPWSSSSVTHIPGSPSRSGYQRLNDQSPLPYISKQSPLSGSWSILEEVSKVRAKATEDLLRARSSFNVLHDTTDEPQWIAPSQISIVDKDQVVKAMDSNVEEGPPIDLRNQTCDVSMVVPESDNCKYNNGDVSDPYAHAINVTTQEQDSKKEAENSSNGHVPTDVATDNNNLVSNTKQGKKANEGALRRKGKVRRSKVVASYRIRGRHVAEKKEVQ